MEYFGQNMEYFGLVAAKQKWSAASHCTDNHKGFLEDIYQILFLSIKVFILKQDV